MSARYLQVFAVYGAFLVLSVVLTSARRPVSGARRASNVWRKYPGYILLNLVFLAAALLPGNWHTLAFWLALIAAGGSWEIARALGLGRVERAGLPVLTAGLVLAAEWLTPGVWMPIFLCVLLSAVVASALASSPDRLGGRVAALAGAIVYVPICLSSLLWIWHAGNGDFRVVFLYLVIAVSDAFAQITGQAFGRRLLAPRISPGKTIAGAIGGGVCALVLGGLLSATVGWPAVLGACVATVLAVAAQIGDLVESSWKRALGMKDFSAILGAQGGVLDRFDALLLAAPVFFLLLNAFEGMFA